jgi:hypothetical protein
LSNGNANNPFPTLKNKRELITKQEGRTTTTTNTTKDEEEEEEEVVVAYFAVWLQIGAVIAVGSSCPSSAVAARILFRPISPSSWGDLSVGRW